MAYQEYNPNPNKRTVGDCVVRALTKLFNSEWYKIYSELAIQGYLMGDMPSSNAVWTQYLKSKGYHQHVLPDTCPDCYTVRDFCEDYPTGKYLLATGTHTICVIDGTYFDSWDSGDETPIWFFEGE